jgi:transposase
VLEASRLVFIDETGAATNMVRRHGWGRKGKRVKGLAPHGHWKTTTFVAGLRGSGMVAPMVTDGPMNGELFKAYVKTFLVRELRPGDIVIMDNLQSHKSKEVAEAIAAARARLVFLPPYSPDLNPIEMAFSKLKTLLRKAAERTQDALWQRIGALIGQFKPQECQNYFRHAGYAST